MDFEYAIVGGGPAGYTAAMFLAKQGHSVVLFEKNKLGGTCLNKGCIPVKSILHSSEVYYKALHCEEYGLNIELKSFDFSKIIQRKDSSIEKIRKSLELAVKNSGVEIVYADAKILDKNTISTNSKVYNVQQVVSAVGAKPKEIKGLEFDGKFILSSDDILSIQELPKSVLIVGSGAIGIEWARILSNFGVEVYLTEVAENLIPMADIEVSKRIERIFKQKKISFSLNDYIDKIEDKKVFLKSEKVLTPDFILVAAGRAPLDNKIEGVIYLGDVCGEILLAHNAIHQAKNFAVGVDYNKTLVPSVIYGSPEIAWVGKREQDCTQEYKKIVLPISALGKAWCDDSLDGFIKLIVEDDFIVGAHIVSNEASALIHEVLIAMQNKISTEELKKVCFAHPTYSEGIFEALMRL